jgi:GNAT superfamily N-acetyltransferase
MTSHGHPASTVAVQNVLMTIGQTVVRQGRLSEIDAALAVWRMANSARNLSNHAGRLRAWAHDPDAALLVADDRGRLVGMALRLQGRADDGAGQPIPGLCHLTGICVTPERQGQRVGGRLLDAILVGAREDGYLRATLWTHTDNPRARSLFETRGFVHTGRTVQDEAGAWMLHLERVL